MFILRKINLQIIYSKIYKLMASISATILKHHKKHNGTWNVKIRISHKGSSVYIDTSIVAKKEDLDTKLRLKKIFVDKYVTTELNRLRDIVNSLGIRVDSMSAQQLKQYMSRKEDEVLDFFVFFEEYISKSSAKTGTILKRNDSIRRLKEFVGRPYLSPMEFTVSFLNDFQEFLKKPKRADAIARGIRSTHTILGMINSIKVIFNAMKDKYNNEDTGEIRIPNDPFRKFVPIKLKQSMNRNLTLSQIKDIRDLQLIKEKDVIARDLFMLSFYLCGANASDIFNSLNNVKGDRFNYNRVKTESKRMDNAYISIQIPEEAKNYIIKYSESLYRRYNNMKSLNNRLSISLREIGLLVGIERLTFYHARHTFATLARNECRFSKDDVAAALNHSSSTVTDTYIAKDWSIIDDVQNGVLDLLKD